MTWLLAKFYDRIMREAEDAGLGDWRRSLLAPMEGSVLEIGAGTGVNLPYYPESVTKAILAEPDNAMRKQLLSRVKETGRETFEVIGAGAETLPHEDASFDCVVSTLVLCTVRDLDRSVSELFRVLKPNGKLLFIEHVLSWDKPGRARWQRRISPIWKYLAGGCHCDRETETRLKEAGFRFEQLRQESLRKVPSFVRPSIRGIAIKPNRGPQFTQDG